MSGDNMGHQYRKMLEAMCEHVDLADRETFLESGLLNIDGTDVCLVHDQHADPEQILLRLDVGAAPDENRLAIWRGLLVSNFEWGDDGRAGFSLMPHNDHLLLTLRRPLGDGLSGARLAEWLSESTRNARALWKDVLEAQTADRDTALAPLGLMSLERA
jgi:hypothetical protein